MKRRSNKLGKALQRFDGTMHSAVFLTSNLCVKNNRYSRFSSEVQDVHLMLHMAQKSCDSVRTMSVRTVSPRN